MTEHLRSPGRLTSLDGLRGIAALIVVVHHCLLTAPSISDVMLSGRPAPATVEWFVYSPLHLLWAGGEAVLVFFVLSGFVLTRSAASARFTWRSYYPARMLRLYLPVAASVVFAIGMALAVPRVFARSDGLWMRLHSDALAPWSIWQAVTLVAPTPSLNSPLWSLRWEVLFSLLLPAYVCLLRVGRPWLVLAAVVVAATISGIAVAVPDGSGTNPWKVGLYLPVFAVGSVLAFHLDAVHRWAAGVTPVHTAVLATVSGLLLVLPWLFGANSEAPSGAWATGLQVLGAAGIVVLAMCSSSAQRFLELPIPRWLGRVSFSLYLVHEPIVVSIGLLLPAEARWATACIAVPIALVMAESFFRLIERPSNRLSQTVTRRLRRPTTRAELTLS